jgi:hypothetical protein
MSGKLAKEDSLQSMDVASAYGRFTQWIGDGTGASDALLHVHAGLAVLLIARLVTRRSLATPIPFAIVCLAELVNEVLDRIHYGSWRWWDTSLDVVNTLFWPFVLMIGLRLRSPRGVSRHDDKAPTSSTGALPEAGQ